MGSQEDSGSEYCSQGDCSINVWTGCNQKCVKKHMHMRKNFTHVVALKKGKCGKKKFS